MAKRGNKLTPMQVEFKKQQKRIKNFIRRAEKRGYHFEEGLIPEMSKRVTKKALEDIKRINQYKLYGKSVHYYKEGDEPTPGKERRKYERSWAGERANVTRNVNKLMKKYGYDKETARTKFYEQREERDRQERESWARSRGYNSWDDLVYHNEKRERQREWDDLGHSEALENQDKKRARLYAKDVPSLLENKDLSPTRIEEKVVEIERVKPVLKIETPEEKIARLEAELAEAKKELEEKKDLVTEASESNEFYKDLYKQIDEKAKGAQQKYYDFESRMKKDSRKKSQSREHEREEKLVLETIEDIIATWEPAPEWTDYWAGVKEKDKNRLDAMLKSAIATEGRTAVAQRLQEKAEYVISLVDAICYGSGSKGNGRDDLNRAFTEFSSIIMGRSLTFEENATFTQYSEEGAIFN